MPVLSKEQVAFQRGLVDQLCVRLEEKVALKDVLPLVAHDNNVAPKTLEDWYYRWKGEEMNHGNAIMTFEEEQTILNVCQAFSIANVQVSNEELVNMVEETLNKHPSRKWASRFLKKHKKDLRKRTCKALSGKRAATETMEDIHSFIKSYKEFTNHHHFNNFSTFNIDETIISNNGEKLVLKRIESTQRQRAETEQVRDKTVGSLTTIISAAGELVLSVYCIKVKINNNGKITSNISLEKVGKTRSTRKNTYYTFNETGRVDAETFETIIDKFYDLWQQCHPGGEDSMHWCFLIN